ncbi:hypothetical protein V6N13_070734 [Hibiscus sabdariffa]|uniref:Uncharacterized protein n=1 Tax=Hibiscus sabdariffa TaxID=183260 RepID=A0ABR2TFJ4_9ROSI
MKLNRKRGQGKAYMKETLKRIIFGIRRVDELRTQTMKEMSLSAEMMGRGREQMRCAETKGKRKKGKQGSRRAVNIIINLGSQQGEEQGFLRGRRQVGGKENHIRKPFFSSRLIQKDMESQELGYRFHSIWGAAKS